LETSSILKKKTEYWKKKLIDLSKRNNLISYRFTKSKSIKIIAPDFNKLLTDLNDEKPIYISKTQPDEPKEGLWVSNEDEEIVDKKITNLYRKARENFQELGISTCYLGLGFLKYDELEKSKDSFLAPIFLYPISIERLSSISKEKHRFKIVSGTDDLSVNPALIEKISNDYGIELPVFEDDVVDYIEKLKKSLSGFQTWKIILDAYLDIFSYQKYIMYADIEDNDALIQECNLIKGFVGDRNALQDDISESQRDEFDEDLNGIDVLPTDSTQKKAIELSKAGVTFVLQGPPGTGKSQTIVNIISALMQQKKKILFVSQKMAALNVVQKRLEDVGLGRYSLNLHNYRGNKKEIVHQLVTELETSPKINDNVKRYSFNTYLNGQEKINKYYKYLCEKHKPRNYSIYDLRGELSKLHNVVLISEPLTETIEYTEERFSQIISIYDKLDHIRNEVHNPLISPYYYFNKDKNTGINREKFKNIVHEIKKTTNNAKDLLENIEKLTNVRIENLKQFNDVVTKHELWSRIENIPEFFVSSKFYDYKELIENLYEAQKSFNESKKSILKITNEDFLNISIKKYIDVFENTNIITRLFNKEYKEAKNELFKYTSQKLKHNDWIELFEQKVNYDDAIKKHKKYSDKHSSLIKSIGQVYEVTNLKHLKSYIDKLEPFFTWATAYLEKNTELIIKYFFHNKDNKTIYDEFQSNLSNADEFFTHSQFQKEISIEKIFANIEMIIEQQRKIDTLFVFRQEYSKLSKELKSFTSILFEKDVKSSLKDTFLKSYYIQYMDKTLEKESILAPKSEIEQFRNLDFEVRDMQRFKIMEHIEEDQPSHNYHSNGISEVSILKREAQKKRRLKPIRNLLEQIPNLVFALKPCFMMSPLSVSQYINPKNMKFDVVIFDEASQIMPEDAVPCLLRAKQAIVVGDTQQLPPTSFFMSRDDEDVEEEIEDLESFLSECSTKFRTKPLLWHYRSKNENLIAFSNKFFYDNRLITFPNAKDSEGVGLDFVYVKDAIYDRGKSRKNQLEAREVINQYKKMLKNHPKKSIGIIAFSMAQENAIREEFKVHNIDVDGKIDTFSEDLFIKNLETVQGDERDIIILSVGYGKDGNGRFSYNFGPINKEGGYKRLNVAVTRSRYNTIVVSSMDPKELDDSKLNSDGPKYLKAYLRFAKDKDISLFTTVTEHLSFDSNFEESVYDALIDEGFDVVSQVGCSGYRIDLAIKHPKHKGDYLLGIECDGAQYHSSKFARDRDKVRQFVLESLGWNIHRIWSDDWLKNRESEIEFIKIKIDALLNKKSDMKKENRKQFEKVEDVKDFEQKSLKEAFPEYVVAELPYQMLTFSFDKISHRSLINRMVAVAEVEGPIEKELLFQRIVDSFGIRKIGNRIRSTLEGALRYSSREKTLYVKGETVNKEEILNMYPVRISTETQRPFVYIPKEELAGAITEILKINFSATENTIIKDVAKELYHNNRTGNKIQTKLKDAIKHLKSKKVIKEENGRYMLVK
jgi:very-short-patch-repair endonuclease